MTTSKKIRIGIKDVRDLGEGWTLWDTRVSGFCARRRKSAAVFYALKYRTGEGRQRWHTIGRHGAPWTPDTARDEAQRVLSEVVQGKDPAAQKLAKRRAATVADLCDEYLKAAAQGRLLTRRGGNKKESTLATDRSRIEAHIKPLLGDRKVPEVTRQDIEKFMHDVAGGTTKRRSRLAKPRAMSNVRGGRGAATRTVGLLGAIFSYAVRTGLRANSPVVGIIRFADARRDRRLTDCEYKQFGAGAAASSDIWPYAIAAARFLALTGWRSGEALKLRWSDLDLQRHIARLPDTKTGASTRALSLLAVRQLRELPSGSPNDLVFPSSREGVVMSGFPSLFEKIVRAGGLSKEVTPHVLRHSFASVAADLGFSELTIAALIGHRGGSVTARYTHHADAVLLAAADQVGGRIADLMSGEDNKVIRLSLRERA
ncbi:integrase [Bradyrhizobium sp. I1.8.5]|uniref:tyrosine-type recombinase/integrase n=1 Tax=Bradyrhizobium sp. I1.8.5 TaxID=3156365 RepID=UPI0033958D07